MSLEEDFTALIDYERYQKHVQPKRIQRQTKKLNETQSIKNGIFWELLGITMTNEVCADAENEVYQMCGSKCVLGCRYATTSSGITLSKNDCEKNDCVEGCFCKTGLVRHQTKCIPASECPIRKCNQRYEVYVSQFARKLF